MWRCCCCTAAAAVVVIVITLSGTRDYYIIIASGSHPRRVASVRTPPSHTHSHTRTHTDTHTHRHTHWRGRTPAAAHTHARTLPTRARHTYARTHTHKARTHYDRRRRGVSTTAPFVRVDRRGIFREYDKINNNIFRRCRETVVAFSLWQAFPSSSSQAARLAHTPNVDEI